MVFRVNLEECRMPELRENLGDLGPVALGLRMPGERARSLKATELVSIGKGSLCRERRSNASGCGSGQRFLAPLLPRRSAGLQDVLFFAGFCMDPQQEREK